MPATLSRLHGMFAPALLREREHAPPLAEQDAAKPGVWEIANNGSS
jgi:hypothetical protein